MVTRSIEQEYCFLEFEDMYVEFDPFVESEAIEGDETESRPNEAVRWGYRIPCPGVKYYTFE